MKFFRFSILVSVFIYSVVNAQSVKVITDSEFVRFANNFELIAEKQHPRKCSVAVQIFKIRDSGECSGWSARCPKSRIFIALSNFGEFPDQFLYELPRYHNWEFIEWLKCPKFRDKSKTLLLKFSVLFPKFETKDSELIKKHLEVEILPKSTDIRFLD